MKSCILFGGAGYIGTHLARHLLRTGRFDRVHIADIQPSALEGSPGVTYSHTDVRRAIPVGLNHGAPQWIFNLAAIHREPGHESFEYYDTNLPGARNICDYATTVGCDNIYFTSSISVYGPTPGATDESSVLRPTTPYGGSKLAAEYIHQMWRQAALGRRLIVSRPGVIYGPGDPGNILRMIRAIKRGYFAFPGSPDVHKSYGYIYGLLDSIDFLMDSYLSEVTYNYVEVPTQPLREIVDEVKKHLNCRALVLPLPIWSLLPAAHAVQALLGRNNPVHPVRVRKAATPTHIIPQRLSNLGFRFRYTFAESLAHWQSIAPEDFGLPLDPERADPISAREGSAKQVDNEALVD